MRWPDIRGKDTVAIVLAIGLVTAINAITIAVLYDAIASPDDAGISENGTQILTTAFGGIIGVLGGFVGYAKGRIDERQAIEDEAAEHEDDDGA